MCGGLKGQVNAFQPAQVPDSQFGGAQYDPLNYPEINGGAGIRADLGGNELPNAPHSTANFGVQPSWALSDDRSEERRVGKECVSPCISWLWPIHYQQKTT